MQVKTYAVNNSSGHTFYVMDASGDPPSLEQVPTLLRFVHTSALKRLGCSEKTLKLIHHAMMMCQLSSSSIVAGYPEPHAASPLELKAT